MSAVRFRPSPPQKQAVIAKVVTAFFIWHNYGTTFLLVPLATVGDNLLKQIKGGNTIATISCLKSKCKKQGYIENEKPDLRALDLGATFEIEII